MTELAEKEVPTAAATPERSAPRPPSAARSFHAIWVGQLVSIIGTGLTGFALSIWVFRRTGSTTYFALVTLATTLPAILATPVAGALADRFDRRKLMLAADTGAGLSVLAIAALLAFGVLQLWHLYVLMGLASLCAGVQGPAYMAVVGQMVPKEQFAKVSGLMQMSRGAQYVISPVLAGALMQVMEIQGILVIDFFTFLFALYTLFSAKVPPLHAAVEEAEEGTVGQLLEAWRYLLARPGLLGLFGVIAAANLMVGFLIVLVGPMILSFSTPAVLGIMNSCAACGMVAGSIGMAALPPPRRMVRGIVLFMVLAGAGIGATGILRHPVPLTAAAFVFFTTMPLISGYQETLIRRKVPNEMQGRVFAFSRFFVMGVTTLAFVTAGPLADRLFEPLMSSGGSLARALGAVVGTGKGRGIALMLLLAGVAIVVVAAAGSLVRPFRRLESEIPDVL